MNCSSEDKYTKKDGICCDRCAAGQYMLAECDDTHTTKCGPCGPGRYTATKNHLPKCYVCKDCSSINNQRKVKDCTEQENTVCRCMPGFYCVNDPCDHCWEVTLCLLGEGVKVQAAHTNDTLCAPCQDGTYSNVTDFHSACQAHTRCEDFGRVLKTPGTPKADAICGNFKSHCPWILPTGLWSGLLLTALILFGLICWRAKRKSYKAEKKETRTFLQNPFTSTGADSCVAISLVEMAAAAPSPQPETSSPITEGHHRDSCPLEGCTPPLFIPDDSVVSCDTHEHVDGSHPQTPLRASVSFTDSHHINGNAGYRPGHFLRTYSEPQEDEWCGT
ncbi:tumor necrosis factor receptor superfamily member 5 [Pseudoliparis swirei]|uniref:tumor necrosis factor receptor superfamily member 5 n=1 Tax=Pseudoliparis swirei TaxID=2059687 RepID=UPI0024BE4ADC|nr:tumor necrosis factor receptor superfamily member 5 [Pseudoliparis swirei]